MVRRGRATAADHGGLHRHGHDAAATPRLAIAFAITLGIFAAQLVGSALTGSLALLTDTLHMLVDVTGLLIALIAAAAAHRPPTPRRTWGLRRLEVLAALAQSAVLLGVGVYAAIEGVMRLLDAPEVTAAGMLVFGLIGLTGNIASIAVLAGGREATFNARAAFLEVLGDGLGSLAVIVAGAIALATGWGGADAIAGIVIAALIIPRALTLLRDTVNVLLEATPAKLDLDAVRAHLLAADHVVAVHDLHASTVATGLPTLSAHIVLSDECFRDGHAPEVLLSLKECLRRDFDIPIEHSTLQLEPPGLGGLEPENHR